MEDFTKVISKALKGFTVQRLIYAGIAVLITVAVLLTLRSVYKRFKKRINAEDDIDSLRKLHTLRTVYRLVKAVVIVICVIAVLQINGVNVTSVVILISVLAAVVAVEIKDMFQDFFAGYIIMADHYFKVGDAVEFEGRDGIVIFFSIRTTKIELLDDRTVLSVGNRNISKIRRLNHLVDIDLPLSYDLDREEAFEILEGVCGKIRRIDGVESCELKGTQQFGESAAIYRIRFFCEPNDRPDIRREVLRTIQDGLDAAGIRIPYQQLDIHSKDE